MPKFPLYIPSKGRYKYMVTSKVLTKMGVNHSVVVEPHEVKLYEESIKSMGLLAEVIPLDLTYKSKYELCDNLGLSKSTGSGPARNFIWDHSIKSGYDWHWIMDDNIKQFFRLNNNLKVPIISPSFWEAMADFVLRYKNVAMAGPHYECFVPRKEKVKPFILNTRIYSCNLIRNDVPFRWRGRYNEDTILSLDMLKAGWCTILFQAFLAKKMETQKLQGGNTDELYHGKTKSKSQRYSATGTIAKSQMLVDVHPDVSRIAWRFGRVHHHVDYTKFKNRKLIKREDYSPTNQPNESAQRIRHETCQAKK